MYRIKILPRDYRKIEMRLSEISQKNEIIRINSDLSYCIIQVQERKNMEEKKKYIVKQMPNNISKIEDLFNSMDQEQYKPIFVTDYSVIFVKDS